MRLQIHLYIPILLFSCVEIIEIDVDQKSEIMIYGKVTNSYTHTPQVWVNTTGFGSNKPQPISTAEVQIVDLDENLFEFQFHEEGYYVPTTPFLIDEAQSYQLKVCVDDQDYHSTFEYLPKYIGSDSLYTDIIEEDLVSPEGVVYREPVLTLYANSTLPSTSEDYYLRWEVEEVWTFTEIYLPRSKFPLYSPGICYMQEFNTPDNLNMYTSKENNATSIDNQIVAKRRIDISFDEVRYMGLVQYSISENAYQYWKRINQIINRNGGLFDVPPASVPGNITSVESEKSVLGFFEVARVDTSTTIVTRADMIYDIEPICGFIPWIEFYDIPVNCFSCLSVQLGIDEVCYSCLSHDQALTYRPTYLP